MTTTSMHVDQSQLSTLEWAQQALSSYVSSGLVAKPTDFQRSFSNGVAFLCLVHRCDASLVKDVDAMAAWLSSADKDKSDKTRDPAAYLATLRSLRIVYAADQKQWQLTCDRALRLAQQLLRFNHNLNPRDLSTNSADKKQVEVLVNQFRLYLTKSTAFDYNSTRDISLDSISNERVSHPRDPPQEQDQDSSFLGMKSLWNAFGAPPTSEVISTKSTFETRSVPTPPEPIFTKKEIPTAPPPTPIRESTITTTTTTTTNAFETIDLTSPVDESKSTPRVPSITLSPIPQSRDVPSTVNVRALANAYNQPAAESYLPQPTFTERRSSLNRKAADPHFKAIVTTTTTKKVTDEKGDVVDVVVEKNVEVLDDVEVPDGEGGLQDGDSASGGVVKSVVEEVTEEKKTVVVTTGGDDAKKDSVGTTKPVQERDAAGSPRPAMHSTPSVPSDSYRTTTTTTRVTKDHDTVQSPTSMTLPRDYATDVTVQATSTPPPAQFTKPAKQRSLKKFKASGPGIVYSDDDFEDEGVQEEEVVVESKNALEFIQEAFWPTTTAASTTTTTGYKDVETRPKNDVHSGENKWNIGGDLFKPSPATGDEGGWFTDTTKRTTTNAPRDAPDEYFTNSSTVTTTTSTSPEHTATTGWFTPSSMSPPPAVEQTRRVETQQPPVDTFWQRGSGSSSSSPAAPVQDLSSTRTSTTTTTTTTRENNTPSVLQEPVLSSTAPTVEQPKKHRVKIVYGNKPVASLTPPVESGDHRVKIVYGNKPVETSSNPPTMVSATDKRDIKTQMVTTVQQMQADMDAVARKRSSGGAGVQTEVYQPQQRGSAGGNQTEMYQPQQQRVGEVVGVKDSGRGGVNTTRSVDVVEGVGRDGETVVKTTTTTTKTVTSSDTTPNSTPTVYRTVTSSSSTSSDKTPTTAQPLVYSKTYRDHISESLAVLSVCETELLARHKDYMQFSAADLNAWMDEIKATAGMFVEVGGSVLEAEWREHGFAEGVVGPHVDLVKRAKEVVRGVEEFKGVVGRMERRG
ncbi:hypothetical protein HDU98_006581 [Podochytrium sp. JEL0797]|nr:hypothetical protein HDU98_006581 [Podochytrium sp. JEL0797]